MIITKMFNKNIHINSISNLKTYLTKDNLSILIKIITISLYILFNIALFSMFMFFFILLYIKELSFGYIFEFKLPAFIYSIICSWVNLVLLSPIIFVPNLFIFGCMRIFLFAKNKLFSNI